MPAKLPHLPSFPPTFISLLVLACCLLARQALAEDPSRAEETVSFSRDIQPLLAKHCLACHGPDEAESGLRLDTQAAAHDPALAAIVPGNSAESQLLERVISDDPDLRMPPSGDPLSAAEVTLLRSWIDDGAPFEQHWAYRPVHPPAPPMVHDEDWIHQPTDRFVLAKLESKNLKPSPTASPATLVKRLHYDLIGLPPSLDTVDTFVADPSDTAYEALVDRLLASEHFGERWARHWLDKARYADSDGYEKDRPRPNAWRYRDWVIQAINEDLPYDQFTIQQLAGDLLPNPTPDQRLATAFHRQTLTNTEGGVDQEEFRVEATFDRTETTSAVWLGLTMTCARCHSHKYDQITQHEYYGLYAFFDDADEATATVPPSDDAMAQYEQQRQAHETKRDQLVTELLAATDKLTPSPDEWAATTTRLLADSPTTAFEYQPAKVTKATTDSGSTLTELPDGSWLVTGATPDKDRYTLLLELPTLPITGIRIETLPDEGLPNQGPGRAPNGNFVLTHIDASLVAASPSSTSTSGDTTPNTLPVPLAHADADFTQGRFAATAVFDHDAKTGWAIAPQMSKPHHWEGFASHPITADQPATNPQKLRLVIDQQYGGKHTLGRFRVAWITGYDPQRVLPDRVLQAVRKTAAQRSRIEQGEIAAHLAVSHPTTRDLAQRWQSLRASAPKPPTMQVRVMKPARRDTHLLYRGDFLQPAEQIEPAALEVISQTHPLRRRQADQPADRLDLARWLVHPDHPLTARVTVNQVWAHLFGTGLVPTVNDFGVRGDQPTHAALLDWLAWHFPRNMGWSRKQLIKSIVMSATYRQASKHRPELQTLDPTNHLLARQNRFRVSAEIVRDLHLDVSGLLSRKVGGPSVFPPLPPGVAELSYANNFKWKTSAGEDAYRRGMYTFFKRTSPHPTLISFDCPDSNTTRLQRPVSNTPLQALVTLNNEVFTEAAEAFSREVLQHSGESDTMRLQFALRRCLARSPQPGETARFAELLAAARQYYTDAPEDAARLTKRYPASQVASSEQAAWVATLRMIMNLDEFIVRD